jgi:hypothetical protein
MPRKILIAMFALAVLLIVSASAMTTHAQSGGAYELTWSTIDGGGATFSVGGSYELGGTIGQPDAGAMGGGAYTLAGGFWGAAQSIVNQSRTFLPLITR